MSIERTKTTDWRPLNSDGERIRATYGFHYLREEAVAEFDHYGLYPDEILLSVGRGGLGVEDSLELMGVDFDVEREEAWGDARENACGNCLI